MKVYIACHHPDPANELAAALKAAGHEVVSTWHTSAEPRPAADDAAAWGAKTLVNEVEIYTANALVVVASPEHVSRVKCVPGGKFVEAGYARAMGKRLFTVGGVENGALWHPRTVHCKDGAELVAAIQGA